MAPEKDQLPQSRNFPNFSESLAQSIYTESIENPYSYLVSTAEDMNKDNPAVLDFLTESSFGYIAGGYSWTTALALLEGASFVYRFFSQDAIDRGTDIVKIDKSVINRLDKEDKSLKSRYKNAKTHAAQQSAYQAYRERGFRIFRRMEKNNPSLHLAESTKLEAMNLTEDGKALFLFGVASMYEFFDQAYQHPMVSQQRLEPVKENEPNKPPIVEADIARMGMALILIDQKKYIRDVLGDMGRANPGLEKFIKRKSAEDPNTEQLQLLLSSYTFYCLDRQYKRLGKTFPTIEKKTIDNWNARVNEEYSKARSTDQAIRRLLEPADSLRLENSELNARAMILLQTYVKYGEGKKFGAVMGGIFVVLIPLQEQLVVASAS